MFQSLGSQAQASNPQRHRLVLYRVMFGCVCVPNDLVDSFKRRGTDEKPMKAYFSIRQGHNHVFITHGRLYYIESCWPVRLDPAEVHGRLLCKARNCLYERHYFLKRVSMYLKAHT